MNGYEKGLELERLVAQLFSSKGYFVKHNMKFRGRSGVEHQIDVYAEYRAPLHTSRIIIECKAYDKPVDKDVVMKLIQEVLDIGVDRGILVTTSYFTPDAVSIAKDYPIDLWEYSRLRELLAEIEAPIETVLMHRQVFHVNPSLSPEEAREKIKGDVLGEAVVFYPYFEVECELLLTVKEGFLRRTTKERVMRISVLADAVVGDIVTYSKASGFTPVMPLLKSLELSRDELEALRVLAENESMTVPALASRLSWSGAKARKALQGLASRGVVKMAKAGRQIYYTFKKPRLEALSPLSPQVTLSEGEPKTGILVKPQLDQADIKESLEALWDLKAEDQRLIYYPYYIAKVSEKGGEEIKVIDLVRGAELKGTLQRIFTQMVFADMVML